MTAPLDLSLWRVWAFRAVYTQANVAGGAIVVDFTAGGGNTIIVLHALGTNSGTNTLQIARVDEDNSDSALFCNVASSAASSGVTPLGRVVTTATATTGLLISSDDWLTRIFSGISDKFTIRQTGAGAAADTLTVDVRALVRHGVLPTRAFGRSTNPGDVTETAPTINRFVT